MSTSLWLCLRTIKKKKKFMEKPLIFVHYPEDIQLSGTRTSAELLPGPKSLCVYTERVLDIKIGFVCSTSCPEATNGNQSWEKNTIDFLFSFQDFFPPHTSSSATGILLASCSGATFRSNQIFHVSCFHFPASDWPTLWL